MTQHTKQRTLQRTLVLALVFSLTVATLGAINNRPDLAIDKIFTTKECKLAVTIKNKGPGLISRHYYEESNLKGIGIHVTIDGKDWGVRHIWQFDKTRKLKSPGGTATCVFNYNVAAPVNVAVAIDVYNILMEPNVSNNKLSQEIDCDSLPEDSSDKPQVPAVIPYMVKPPDPEVPEPEAKTAPKQFSLDFKDITLVYKKSFDSLRLIRDSDILSYGRDWETCQLKPHLFHIRHEAWQGVFWEIDTVKEEVNKVTGIGFCGLSQTKEKLPVILEDMGNSFSISFPSASLVYSPAAESMQVLAAGAVLCDGMDWEKCRLSNSQYHLKEGMWNSSYWKVDTLKKKAWRIDDNRFCKPGGNGETLTVSVRVRE